MSNPEMDVVLVMKRLTAWLTIEEDALPPHPEMPAGPVSRERLVSTYGALLHAVVIDKILSGEAKVRDRYVVRASDF